MQAGTDVRGALDERFSRMETAMRQLEAVQAGLKSGQRWLQWGGGLAAAVIAIVSAVLVGVVVLQLQRSDSLSDRIADVQVETGKLAIAMDFVRDNVKEIKDDTRILRSDLGRVASALDVKLEERTELTPQ